MAITYTWTAELKPPIGEGTGIIWWEVVASDGVNSYESLNAWPVWDPLPENPTQDELLNIVWAGPNKKDSTEEDVSRYLLLQTE